MKVITLTKETFPQACRQLAAKADVRPDVLVAIRTGGAYVGRELCEIWSLTKEQYIEVELQRPSTAAKRGLIAKVISKLPQWMADWLRVMEASVLSWMPRGERHFEYSAEQLERLTQGTRVMVVDDAVDSGMTMSAVVKATEAATGTVPATAAIVVTCADPAIRPDFSLYNNVLIRFPWSKDAK